MPAVRFIFSDKRFTRVLALKEKVGVETISDVLEHALDLYEAVVNEGDKNARLIVTTENGEKKTISIFRKENNTNIQ